METEAELLSMYLGDVQEEADVAVMLRYRLLIRPLFFSTLIYWRTFRVQVYDHVSCSIVYQRTPRLSVRPSFSITFM
jgi:hypothetical protein